MLLDHLLSRAGKVREVLEESSHGRMISEWAKKEACWEVMKDTVFSSPAAGVPEIKQ